MIAAIQQPDNRYIYIENGEPECGEDFCNMCGDCLHCHGSDECSENEWGAHAWVIYRDAAASGAKEEGKP